MVTDELNNMGLPPLVTPKFKSHCASSEYECESHPSG